MAERICLIKGVRMTTQVYVAFKGGVAMAIPEFQTRHIRRFKAVTGCEIDLALMSGREYDWDDEDWAESIWMATEAEDVPVFNRAWTAKKKKRYYGVFAQYTYVDLEGIAHTVSYMEIVDQKPKDRQPTDSWKWNRRRQTRNMGARRVRMSHEAFLYPSEIKALRQLRQIDRQNLISTANADTYWEEMDRRNNPDDMGWLGVEHGDMFNMGALEWVWRSEGSDRADELKAFLSAVQARIEMLEAEMAKPAVVWPKLRIVG